MEKTLYDALEQVSCRSAWDRGVREYAQNLLYWADMDTTPMDEFPTSRAELKDIFLNGATDWEQFTWSGMGLCYDKAIAETFCSPSEFKKTKEGALRPNKDEEWLDVEARGAYQAFLLICKTLGI